MPVELDLAGLPPGSRRLIRVGSIEIAVFNVEGRVFAVNNVCPHRGGPLIRGTVQITPDGAQLRCPMHGWPFRLATGESVRPGRATVYPVTVHGERIEIDIGAAMASIHDAREG
jgi:nitrite reductase/ring-hydroxylating ferredoxin subunit